MDMPHGASEQWELLVHPNIIVAQLNALVDNAAAAAAGLTAERIGLFNACFVNASERQQTTIVSAILQQATVLPTSI